MELLLLLITAHFVADYPLQTNWVYAKKIENFLGGLYHTGITFLAHLFFLLPYLNDQRVVVGLLILALVHHLQDKLKVIVCEKPQWHQLLGYFFDQGLHLTVTGIYFYIISSILVPPPAPDSTLTYFWHNPLVAGFILALTLSTYVFDVTRFVIGKAYDQQKTFQRNYWGMFWRGVSAAVIYLGGIYLFL